MKKFMFVISAIIFLSVSSVMACDGCGCKTKKVVKKVCKKDCVKPCCKKKVCKKDCVKPCCKKDAVKKACKKGCVKPCCKKEVVWLTDFEAAKKLAKKENKSIFIDFSGSDWCGWCIKLDKEVFMKSEFIEYANKNLILVMADFPSKKIQTAEIKKQNKALKAKYDVRGFPTVIILDSNAKKVGQMGYQYGGPKKYVETIKATLAK